MDRHPSLLKVHIDLFECVTLSATSLKLIFGCCATTPVDTQRNRLLHNTHTGKKPHTQTLTRVCWFSSSIEGEYASLAIVPVRPFVCAA